MSTAKSPSNIISSLKKTANKTVALAGASCLVGGGCNFGVALLKTPQLLATSPSSGNAGDTLTVSGHELSRYGGSS